MLGIGFSLLPGKCFLRWEGKLAPFLCFLEFLARDNSNVIDSKFLMLLRDNYLPFQSDTLPFKFFTPRLLAIQFLLLTSIEISVAVQDNIENHYFKITDLCLMSTFCLIS